MIRHILFIAVTSFAISLPSCNTPTESGDVAFAKNTFESLIAGDSSVVDKIDWETFTSLGTQIGTEYIVLAPEEKADFQNAFITQFSSSFRDSGGSIDDFSNWRLESTDESHSEVIADSVKGTLKLTVSERDDINRISALEIIQ